MILKLTNVIYFHIVKYSAVKRNEIRFQDLTQINLENCMLSEISHTQKITYDSIYRKYPKHTHSQRQKEWWLLGPGRGEGSEGNHQ